MNQAEFQASTPYGTFGTTAIDAPADARKTFIRKTYIHLTAAIYAFVALEWMLFSLRVDEWMMNMLGQSQWSWLIVLGGFMLVGTIADGWARSTTSIGMQYVGLFLYVLAESIIFLPLLAIAQGAAIEFQVIGDVSVIAVAAITTLVMFGGLTAAVFITGKDFSFLRTGLTIAGFAAMALIVVSIFADWSLGVWFSAGMVIFASVWILYSTSNVLHHYRTEQYVAAALALFASLALLFWYVLRIALAFSNRD